MPDPSASATRASLLGRLRLSPTDQAAWGEFVDLYGSKVFLWCRQQGLKGADAEDVAQNVLLDLARQMRTFEYRPEPGRKGCFRAWLRTVTHRAWCEFLDRRRRRPDLGAGDGGGLDRLDSAASREALCGRVEEAFDLELLEMARANVRARVEPRTWEAFRLTAVEGLSGDAAAEQLGLQVAAVFKSKSRVLQMLRDEVRRLEDSEPS